MKTSSTLLSSFVTSSSSTTIPGITGERGERGGRRRKVSIFICLLCILFLCMVFTYRASTFSPSQDDEGGRVVGVGGRDDGDDDVTKNTYENADDAMIIGAKEENAFAVEATATPSAEESFREEEEQEEKTEDSKRGTTRTKDEEENDEDERSSPPVITTTMMTKTTPKGNRKRPDERENVPGKYDAETAPKPPFKLPPVYIPRSIAEALEETGRGPTRPCKCVHSKKEAMYYYLGSNSSGGGSVGVDDDDSNDLSNTIEEIEEGEGDSDSNDNDDAEEMPKTQQAQPSKTKMKNAKITFVIFHVANNEEHELSQAQVDGITMVLTSAINKHDRCRLVVLTDTMTDFTPLTNNFPEVLEVRRHEFAQITKGWTTYLRATAEKQFIFDEIEQKPQHLRDNIVFMDSTDVIFAKSIKNVFRDEETKVPHTFGAAWTYRDGSSGANKKWPINFGVRFVNAERIAEAALLSAYFVHAYEWFFYTERPNMRADSTQFFWEQDVANWLARRFKRFKNRKAGDRGKFVDASAPIRYVVESINEEEKGFRCRHVSARFYPCFLFNANPPQTFPVKRLNSGRKNVGCPATTKTSVFHMKGALKRKMQDVFNYYGKPEINVKDGTKPKARRAKKRFDDNNNNNNNNNNTVIEYFGVMSEEDVKSRFSFCESMKSSSSASPAIDDDDDDDDDDDVDDVDDDDVEIEEE